MILACQYGECTQQERAWWVQREILKLHSAAWVAGRNEEPAPRTAGVVLTSESFYLCFFNRTSPHVSFPSVSAQFVVIPTRRATAVAFQSFTSHLLGDAGSPYLIGLVRVAEKQLCALIRVLMVVEGDRITPPGSQFPATAPYIYTMCRQQFSAYLKWAKCKVLLAHVSGGPVSTVVISPPACHWYF